ncbi:MAG: beta-phosphoglucomutase [Gorillibacterium sp.]|nr:beta-phosphoglucomutase [Gorillibacterium sp.]
MWKAQLKAVIFDLDGVIADTNECYNQANRKLAEELAVTISDAENDSFKGIHRSEIVRAIAAKTGRNYQEAEIVALGVKKNEYYQQMIADLSPRDLLPGIKRFLQELTDADMRIALASSSSNYHFVLERLGISHYFHAVADPAKVERMKPAPDIFLLAADLLNVPYAHCAAIEDGEAGLTAVLATPMFSVGIGTAPFLAAANWNLADTAGLKLAELRQRFAAR